MTNDRISNSQEEIMQRVRAVHGVRAWLGSPSAAMLGALAIVFAIGSMVSLGSVVSNTLAHSDVRADLSYFFSSFLHARTIVQVLGSLLVLVAGAVLVNSVKTVRRYGFTPGAISKLLIP